MKIGVSEAGFYVSLILRLLQEGHEVFVCFPPADVPREDLFKLDGLKYLFNEEEVRKAKLDLYIGRELGHEGRAMCALIPGVPVLCHSIEATYLELNRNLAFSAVRNDKELSKVLHLPAEKVFLNQKEAIEFLNSTKKNWVLKQHVTSPQEAVSFNRVVVAMADSKSFAMSALTAPFDNDTNPFFVSETVGGVRFEEYIDGTEVSISMMYRGHSVGFSLGYEPMFLYREYKDAQNGNRSGILTPEIGSTLQWVYPKSSSVGWSIFARIDAMLDRLPDGCGMVDLNLMVRKGKAYLIEFTMRWGRPTMELMMASFEPGALGNYLLQVATDYGISLRTTPVKYNHVVGVTVFNYGLPLTYPPRGLTFKLNHKRDTDTSLTMPSVVLPTGVAGEYRAVQSDGRYYVALGCSEDSYWQARTEAYSAIAANKTYPTFTWRDDIGVTELDTDVIGLLAGV